MKVENVESRRKGWLGKIEALVRIDAYPTWI
jgi:hypothetical protein